MAWRLRSRIDSDTYESIQGKASIQYVTGSLLKVINGALNTADTGLPIALAGATDVPQYMVDSMNPQPYNGQSLQNVNGVAASPLRPATDLLTTTAGERLLCVPINPTLLFDCDVVPTFNGIAVSNISNTLKNTVIIPSTDNSADTVTAITGDFTGCAVYLPEQDWQAVVITSVVAASRITVVFSPPAPRAAVFGDTCSLLSFGLGAMPQWDETNPSLTVSNETDANAGGLVVVRAIDMAHGATKGSLATVTCAIANTLLNPLL